MVIKRKNLHSLNYQTMYEVSNMEINEFLVEDVDDGTEIKKKSGTGGSKKRTKNKVVVRYGHNGNRKLEGKELRHNIETKTKEKDDGTMVHRRLTWLHIRGEDGYTPIEAKNIDEIVVKKPNERTEDTIGYLKENFSFIDIEVKD